MDSVSTLRGVCGVYQIRCLTNGKVYVGSTVDLFKRYSDHWSGLRSNRNPCGFIQRAWNKYGGENFVFEILQFCNQAELWATEQYWIDVLKTTNGKFGYNRANVNNVGVKRSAETRAKIAAVQIGRKHSQETIERRSKAMKMKPRSGGNQSGIENANSRSFAFVSPDGIIHEGQNVAHFARQQNLRPQPLYDMLAGIRTNHQGWTLPNIKPRKYTKNQKFVFLSPDGVLHKGNNITAFAREHGLNFSLLIAVHKGTRNHHKGWTKLN